ncbi:uncharacterized protein TRUGW13939_01679 [Talaromyces rugulosus]|uniref:2EXR domain-containing protein n=1 Tax=Talaromyces rugulosus TaxID=121627 RepID=A0A7H8QM35_TALRU|nr:uncharacterized protein TRUGW13939_01679 [Talaromyces rugulosus]QKX54591.1 hypothetical protein TRUGW13939_01679 [Talaromyces rugulosus]
MNGSQLRPQGSAFHLFPKLPAELRLEIWRFCLPQRICEKDQPFYEIVFNIIDYKIPSPCLLYQTTEVNGRPPVITRVCAESRAVALETGSFFEFFHNTDKMVKPRPPEAQWSSDTSINTAWFDHTRDSIHLNWHPTYEADFMTEGSPLKSLAWDASQAVGGGSIFMKYFQTVHAPKSDLIDFLKQLPTWMVVMRVVVIHTDASTGASTGLFGLLGDSRVQLVDVSDEARINTYMNLAEKREPYDLVTTRQDFRRYSAKSTQEKLRQVIVAKFRSEELLPRLRPVIMFRLCTEMCNRVGSTASLRGVQRARRERGRE